MADNATRPIADPSELIAHFAAGEKARGNFRIGLEHEKIGVLADGSPVPYEKIAQILEQLVARGWSPVREHDKIIALASEVAGTVTLEPGGQLEHSGAPWPSGVACVADNNKHLQELLPIAASLGVTFLTVGFRPIGTLDDVPWMPKGRYRVMRSFLPKYGELAHEMMKRTATVQANLDYLDEADAMEKMRLGLGLSPLITSLFAASPIVDGKITDYQSYRAAIWLKTDPARCGILPFMFEPGASYKSYAEWALDVPMFFLFRGGEYLEQSGITFRRFLRDGIGGERATPADWELHLSTLFPEVRLKRYVEVRQADASTRQMVHALPVLWRGLFYDAAARTAAWKLVSNFSLEQRFALQRQVPKTGIRTEIDGIELQPRCRELVSIAKAGLLRLGSTEGAALLAPLEEIVATGRTRADEVRDIYAETKGDRAELVQRLKFT